MTRTKNENGVHKTLYDSLNRNKTKELLSITEELDTCSQVQYEDSEFWLEQNMKWEDIFETIREAQK